MSGPGARHWEQDKEATVYVGNLDERVTDAVVWELMVQAGRVQNVHLPKDRVTQNHQGFGFVEFQTEEDAEYAGKIMNQVRLYGKPIRVNKASADKQKSVEVGAELFIGNLDPMVDEKILYDMFVRFGALSGVPKIARDDLGSSKGYGFISYGDFESSDAAIEAIHGQNIMGREISVQYAYKKDGKGERHGDEAERMLAKQAKAHGVAPAVQALPAHLFQAQPQQMAPAMPMALEGRGVPGAPSGPSFSGPPGGRPHASLPPPPSGLPARPPGGAPTNFYAPHPGFNGPPPPQGYMPGPPGPPGYPPAAPGYPPAAPGHPGFGGPPGAPPPGAYGRR